MKKLHSAKNLHKENLKKLLSKASAKDSSTTIFNDFLVVAAISLANVNKNSAAYQDREKRFLETMSKYDKETQLIFRDMLAELGLALEEKMYQDVLGEIFHELNLNEQKNGQVFTPQHTGNLMGEIALPEEFVKSEIQRKGIITIKEPCCGSGAITLGALNALLKIGVSPNFQAMVLASDTDERCVLMTYIQLSLYGIAAIVSQQNAISEEIYSAEWLTPTFS